MPILDDASAQAIATRQTTLDLVTEGLRAAILSGRVEPGQVLRQDVIAQEFGVSRQPVRQAIRILNKEGLVDVARHGVATVSDLLLTDVEESFGIRAVLEAEAVQRAVPCLTQEHLTKIRLLHDSLADVDWTSDEWVDLNTRFHEMISGACGWPHLVELIRLERNRIRPYLNVALRLAGRDPRDEHSEILSACERREADLASLLVSKHILRTGQYVMEYVRKRSADKARTVPAGDRV